MPRPTNNQKPPSNFQKPRPSAKPTLKKQPSALDHETLLTRELALDRLKSQAWPEDWAKEIRSIIMARGKVFQASALAGRLETLLDTLGLTSEDFESVLFAILPEEFKDRPASRWPTNTAPGTYERLKIYIRRNRFGCQSNHPGDV